MSGKHKKKLEKRQEYTAIFELTYITVFSLLGVLLILVMLISDWRLWPLPIIIVGIVSFWVVYFAQFGTLQARVYYDVAVTLLGVLYYGTRDVAITDVPIVICLLIVLLSAYREIRLVYLVALSYPVLLLAHIFILRDIGPQSDQLLVSRLVLSSVCLLCAVFISRFFLKELNRERKKQEEMNRQLELARKENEQFLANVSHELRTPINAVIGMSEILMQREFDESTRSDIASIRNAGHRLYGQVSDILDYSELMTGKLKVSGTEYEPLSAVNDAIANVLWEQMSPQLDLALDVQSDLPKTLVGDADKLRKIIVDLLDNTIKFTEQGGAYLYVSTRKEQYGVNLNIDIWDTGIGMSEEQLKHLHRKNYQADAGMERRFGGLGLGLSIVHGIVSSMGGFMSAQSRLGEGTHIHVSIPQEVHNPNPSITVADRGKYRIACYLNNDKYVRPEVATYYGNMVTHIREGLGLELHQVQSMEELKEIVEKRSITHIFIADWEYRMGQSYFEEIGRKVFVNVFADRTFAVPEGSCIRVVHKPVYIMSVVNLLRATTPGSIKETPEKKLVFPGVRALVVDDDRMNLTVAKGVLKSYEIQADTCLSGAEAIDKCLIDDYQIIFMDHMMPGMNGIEAMHKIRKVRKQYYQNIPIVVLTANAVSGAREMFMKEGFDEFVSKPIELSEMSRTLRKMLIEREVLG